MASKSSIVLLYWLPNFRITPSYATSVNGVELMLYKPIRKNPSNCEVKLFSTEKVSVRFVLSTLSASLKVKVTFPLTELLVCIKPDCPG